MIPPTPRQPHTFSECLYRLLLCAYPRAFRDAYATEMLLVLRDMQREMARRHGRWGAFYMWRTVAADLIATVWRERVRSWLPQYRRDLALAGKGAYAMASPFTLTVAQRTDIGRVRRTNEDTFLAVIPKDADLVHTRGALFVVADGMGGHAKGDVASALAVQTVNECYYQDRQHDIPTALRTAMMQANAAIWQASEEERAHGMSDGNMGTTCVAAVLHEQALYAANVGDSRVYVLHAGQLRQITRDHSLVAQMVERGEITHDEARTHAQRNIIYRSLGQPEVEVDLFTEPVAVGDAIILCTDGLSSTITDEDLCAIVAQHDPTESVQQLITRANDAGGPDNVTAIVVRVAAP
jgi:serine/threonine protein phosphatase PrpC